MALPGTFDFSGDNALYRGDKRADRHTFTDTETGDPIDLTDPPRTWRAQIRTSQAFDATVLSDLDVDDADAATGVLVVTIPASETAAVEVSAGYWDLEATLTGDSEDVRTWLAGEVEFVGDATRA